MDIYEIRRRNLEAWIAKNPIPTKERSYISQLKSGKAPFGERGARNLELRLNLDDGFLDREDSIGLPERVSDIDFSIPLLSWARAGAFCEAAGQFTIEDAEEMLPRPLQSMGKSTFALSVRGDSMDMPDGYREGEIVYIDPAVDATPGRDVLAKTDAGYTLKRYKEDESGPYLLQLNGNKIIRPDTHWSVCGVVVFSGRKR